MGDSQTGGGAQLVEILLPDVVEALHVFGQGEIGDVEDVAACHLGVYDAKFQVGFGVGLVVPAKPHMAVPHTLENGGTAFLLVAPLVAPGEMDFAALFMHLVGYPSAKAAVGADDFPNDVSRRGAEVVLNLYLLLLHDVLGCVMGAISVQIYDFYVKSSKKNQIFLHVEKK